MGEPSKNTSNIEVDVCSFPKDMGEPSKNTSSSSIEVDDYDCPPTPEVIPPGSKTPPPTSSSARRRKKGTKRRSKSLDGGRDSPDCDEKTCPICLGDIDNKSMTDTCLHKFCFTCLLEWSKVRAVCPLCKGQFSAIIHNVVSDSEYDRYELPPQEPQSGSAEYVQNIHDFLFSTRRFRYHSTMAQEQLESRFRRHYTRANRDPIRSGEIWRRRRGPGTSDFRRDVYLADLWAQPLDDTRVRETNPEWYRNNEANTGRLVPWLNRELNALLSLSGQQSRQAFLITQICDWIKSYSIGSQELTSHLLPYLGTNTEHFQHELLHFARSPYDIVGYDTNVTYDRRRLATEVVSSDSEGEQTAREVVRRGSRDSRDSDYFVTEIRNRVDAITAERDILDRLRRRHEEGGLRLGVTNYPERRREPSLTERAEYIEGLQRQRQEIMDRRQRQEIRRQPREESQRDYRRELDRLWGLSPRREGSGDRDSRRKRKRPSRFQREGTGGGLSFSEEVLDDEASPRPLDLSVTEVSPGHEETISIEPGPEPGPSTSRGHNSGLTRLVIPDSGSEESDEGNNTLVVDDDDEEEMNRTLKRARARRMAREIVEDIFRTATKTKRVRPHEADIHISEELTSSYENMHARPEARNRKEPSAENSLEVIPSWEIMEPGQESSTSKNPAPSTSSSDQTFTSQVLNNFLASQMQQNSLPGGFGYYTEGAQAYLSELSSMVQFQGPSINTPQAQDEDETENSDLEVVDIVSARPPRQPQTKDPEVVELLSDSEDEAEAPVQPSAQASGGDDDVVLVISSDDDDNGSTSHNTDYNNPASANQPHDYMRMTLNPFHHREPSRLKQGRKSKKNEIPPPSSDSSSDDDLIVVKTEHNTIDPITKKQIVEPVRNKRCNHIYEKSTIYSMIDMARENQKPVRCPYMGCNQRDFKKTDLVKDKDVLGAINNLNDEKVKADQEREKKEAEKRKNKKKGGGGYVSDGSIIEDIDDDSNEAKDKSFDVPVQGIEQPNLSESSSEETNVSSPQKPTNYSTSTSSSSLNSSNGTDTATVDFEVSKNKEKPITKKAKQKRSERLSYSDVNDSSDSGSDVPVERVRNKRSRKPSSRLADSYACSDLDVSEESGNEPRGKRGKRKGRSPKGKKIKVVAKKVTETWCIEKAASKGKKRRKKRVEQQTDESENSDDDSDPEEAIPTISKGKASKGKPPKNAQFSRGRPKRAKQVSYRECDED